MVFVPYIVIGLFCLVVVGFCVYWSNVLCLRKQSELKSLLDFSEEFTSTAATSLNPYLLVNDVLRFFCGLFSVCFIINLVIAFYRLEELISTKQRWIIIVTLLIIVLLFAFLTIILALRTQFKTNLRIPTIIKRLLRWSCRTFVGLFPKTISEFQVDNSSSDIQIRKLRGNRKETMLKGILQFGNETVKDIMTSRVDMVDLDIKTPFSEVIRVISENSYSRVPVYSGTKDNVVGILYIKDVLPYLNKSDKFRWTVLIRPQLSVPETKKIDNLLREFQNRKIHIAVVIDEYGGVSGIVTLEDILEEIVGEINDEYDEDKNPYVSLGAHTYIFDAKTSLQDFCKLFNLPNDFFDELEGDADTIAGLLLDLIGDIPQKHQVVHFHQFKFEVLVVDERHISKIKVSVEHAES